MRIHSHQDFEVLLRGFNAACNGRCQRVLEGWSPDMVLRDRLKGEPTLANPASSLPIPAF